MKRFLLCLSFLFLVAAVNSFGQLHRLNAKSDGTIGEYHTMVDDGTNGDAVSGDGIYSYQLTITDAQSFGQWLVNIDGVGNSLNSWYVTTSPGQDLLFTLNTNSYSDGWLPITNIINVDDQLSSGHSIKIIIDGGSAQTMVDDGSTNGDVTSGDGIYSFHSIVAAAGGHTWNAENSSRGNFHWTALANGRESNSWTNGTSFTTTSTDQDVYFYLNLNTGRVLTKLDAPLPVELTAFTATTNENVVTLNWETATEVNNYGFNIERKSESQEWSKIGFVEGHGNSNSPKYYSYTDSELLSCNYSYRMKQVDIDGTFEYSDVVEINIGTPAKFELSQNYPNPFNPATEINFALKSSGFTSLKIFNALGQEVAAIVNQELNAGSYKYEFDASNLTSGIYYYQLQTNGFSQVRKMILMK